MADSLEFPEVFEENRGAMCAGKLKLAAGAITFKNSKTGKLDQYQSNDVKAADWLKRARGFCLKLRLENDLIHRYDGFTEQDFEKLKTFFKDSSDLSLEEKDLSVRGWNWGKANFIGNALHFDVEGQTAFEVPLNNVSHCVTAKNEVTLEFHQNDDAAISLYEMRFHVPNDAVSGDKDKDKEGEEKEEKDDAVEAFQKAILAKADIVQITGDAIATFEEITFLVPRGRYHIKIYPSFLQLHGKTADYKIPYTTILRLFLLPHKDQRQMFFLISVDPPIKQGQTRYPFLVLQFDKDEEMSVHLNISEEDLEKEYEGKLQAEMSGPTYEVISRVFKSLIKRKITVPGTFMGASGTQAISCSYKAASGFLYPLERGFIFVHKPPLHIRFEEVAFVNFARSQGPGKAFDFEVELKTGTSFMFSSVGKEEYGKLFDFVTAKQLRVKNRADQGGPNYQVDDDDGSDGDEEVNDAYMERMKAEGRNRDSDMSSDDEEYDPDKDTHFDEDVKEEYTSSPSDSGDSDDDYSDVDSADEEKKAEQAQRRKEAKERSKQKKKEEKKMKGESSSKTSSKKSGKDPNMPKRPMSSYFIWMNENRDRIKEEYGLDGIAEVSKKAGELWKEMSESDKTPWEEKNREAKERYEEEMREYHRKVEAGEIVPVEGKSKAPKKKAAAPKPAAASSSSPKKGMSKEYVDSDDISSDSSDSDNEPISKKKKDASGSEDEVKDEPASDADSD